MSYEHQIRTGEFEYLKEMGEYQTPEEAVEAHRRLKQAWEGNYGPGLDAKEWNKVLDEYLSTGKITDGADLYARMNREQQGVVQEIKKSIKRRN